MLSLRYYQQESVDGLFNYFSTNAEGNPLIALPGGTGKSLVIAEFVRRVITQWPNQKILVATHVRELITQSYEELVGLWPTCPAGIYSAGLKRRETHLPVTFCGIASIAKRIQEFGHVDLMLVDEADLISHREGTQYRKAIEALKVINPNLRVIGLTATPYRLGLGTLTDGDIFTDIIVDYTSYDKFNRLVDDGFISPLIAKKTDVELNVDGVHVVGGEFNRGELQAACDKELVTRAALEEALVLAHDRNHWMAFCTGTTHADHTRDMLIEMGISAVSVHSNLPGGDDERDENLRLFKAGMVRTVVGVNVFSRGFNFRPTDCLLIMRPSMSPAWWVQALCRGTRPSPETGKQNCLVLDYAGNTRRLGPINDPVLPRKKGAKGSGMVPFRICPVCQTYNHTRVKFCSSCQYEFPEVVKIAETASDLDLIRREKPKPTPKPAVLEEYDVHRVEFAIHEPRDPSKGRSLKAAYHSGLRIFNEWLCFDSEKGFPRHKAHETWRLMAGTEAPKTTDEALMRVGELRPPVKIRVLHEGKYPQVVGYDFD